MVHLDEQWINKETFGHGEKIRKDNSGRVTLKVVKSRLKFLQVFPMWIAYLAEAFIQL